MKTTIETENRNGIRSYICETDSPSQTVSNEDADDHRWETANQSDTCHTGNSHNTDMEEHTLPFRGPVKPIPSMLFEETV